MGEKITDSGILSLTGPKFVTETMDAYLQSIGANVPQIHLREEMPPVDKEGWIDFDPIKVRIAGPHTWSFHGVQHISFRTWMKESVRPQTVCYEHPELIPSFLDDLCRTFPNALRFKDCGAGHTLDDPNKAVAAEAEAGTGTTTVTAGDEATE